VNSKDLVIILAALVVISGAIFMGQSARATAEPVHPPELAHERLISVNGEASVNVKPDTVVVNIGVQTEAQNARDSIAENASRMNALIDAVKRAGVKDDEMKTARFSVQPRYDYETRGVPNLVGFVTRNTLQITVSADANVGHIIDQAAQAGANIVENVSYQVRDMSKYRDEALKAAVQDARRRADVLAEASGLRITGVKSIVESGGAMPYARAELAVMDQAYGAGSTPVMPGDITIHFSVRVEFTF